MDFTSNLFWEEAKQSHPHLLDRHLGITTSGPDLKPKGSCSCRNNQTNSINIGHWSLKSETVGTKVRGPKSWGVKKGRIGQNLCHSCIFCFLWLEEQNLFEGLGIDPTSNSLCCVTLITTQHIKIHQQLTNS